MSFQRDPEDWLRRYSPKEWIAAGLSELTRAETAFEQRNAAAAYACLKRAAGMALNATLIVHPNESWGRTYVEHLRALASDQTVPPSVRESASRLMALKAGAGQVVSLRTRSVERALVEDARTVMAHAYALAGPAVSESEEEGA